MKKLWLIFAISLSVVLFACQKSLKDKIVGKWQLESVSGEQLSDSEKSTVLEFKADGSATNSMRPEAPAKWELNDKTIKLTIGEGREEVFEDVNIEGDKLTFKQGKDVITLKKI